MSFEYYPCHDDVISSDNVKKIVPKEYEDFMALLRSFNIDLDDYCKAVDCDDDLDFVDEWWKRLSEYQDKLFTAFIKVTGLTLSTGYLREDSNLGGDMASGAFWAVYGTTQLTPAGKKFKDYFKRCYWVEGG